MIGYCLEKQAVSTRLVGQNASLPVLNPLSLQQLHHRVGFHQVGRYMRRGHTADGNT
jgi:hypothetical protein